MTKTYACGLDAAVDVVGGKWKPLLLGLLAIGPRRFGELRRGADGISEKVLAEQLRELARDGLVHRQAHPQMPPKVVYSLTPTGVSLERALAPLCDWGEEYLARTRAARA